MPELPEVHTITQDLKKYVEGATILEVIKHNDYEIKGSRGPTPDVIHKTDITNATRVSKNIVLETNNNHFIQIHLAMTGRLLLRKIEQKEDRWTRVVVKLQKNEKEFELRFCDMRMFGKVIIENAEELDNLIESYGLEPIDENVTPQQFLDAIQSKNTNIKNVLLDQKKISGLGNVYATDALWIAGIHPETRTKEITLPQATKLLQASREILNEGIMNRGISMKDYVDLLGNKGNQQDHFRVYQRNKCPSCSGIIEFKKLNGRGTYFCPNCQQ